MCEINPRCNGTSERVTSRTRKLYSLPKRSCHDSQAFCVFTSALCETALVLFDVVLSVFNYSEMASKQQQAFRMCVHPCPCYLCCLFGRGACTVSAQGRWLWALRCASLADTPIPLGVLSQWGRSGSRSPRLRSRCCRGTVESAVLGFANVSVRRVRDGHSLISTFTWQVQCLVSGLGSTHCGFLRPIEALTLQLSDSEELDVVSANARDTEDLPPQSRAYEELVEVITRAVDWPAEREDVSWKKRLLAFSCQTSTTDVFFLISISRCRDRGRSQVPRVYSTQTSHYSSIINKNEHGYG